MKVGWAAILQNQELLKRLPNESSIYCAEVTAIDLSMNITANQKSSKFIIHSDSKSVLQALLNKNTSTSLITGLLDKMNTLSQNNSIILTWMPSQIDIQGNERADKALLADMSNAKIPYTYLKPIINKVILKKWQKILGWSNIEQAPPCTRYHRRDTLQASHWPQPHYQLTAPKNKRDPNMLNVQSTPYSQTHLINWDRFRQICLKYYQISNLKNLFNYTKLEEILSF